MLDDIKVEFAGKEFVCVDKGFGKNESIDVVIRPEDIKLDPSGEGMLSGTVKSVFFKGVHYEMSVECGDIIWQVQSTLSEQPGNKVGINIFPNDIHIMKKTEG